MAVIRRPAVPPPLGHLTSGGHERHVNHACNKQPCPDRCCHRAVVVTETPSRPCMSEVFDLLGLGTPIPHSYDGGTPSRHRSLSPSPRGRITWEDSQPSSSPQELLAGSVTPCKLPPPLSLEKENIFAPQAPLSTSPSRVRASRTRRRMRAQRSAPYTYNMCAPPRRSAAQDTIRNGNSGNADTLCTTPGAPTPKRPRSCTFERVQSDPVVRSCTNDEPVHPNSDDSFSRILDDDFPIDAAALEEVAATQGW